MTFLDPAAPPRPPLPSDGYSTQAPARPPPPPTLDTTDDESEDLFQHAPTASQGPIMVKETICYLLINNMGVTIQTSFKYMVKMESEYEITSIGLKITVKSSLEKFVLKSLLPGNYFPLVHKKKDFNTKIKIQKRK